MKQNVRTIVTMFIAWIALFIIAKLIFMLCYHNLYAGIGFTDVIAVLWHGLKMDMACAGYLTAIPALILTAGVWAKKTGWVTIPIKVYIAIVAFAISIIYSVDTALYGFWDFKLDITPLYYVMTDPVAAVISAPMWMIIGGFIFLIAATWGLYRCMVAVTRLKRYSITNEKKPMAFAVSLLLTALLFIPIRGGLGVSTVNLSTAYYSNNMRLNHAAVNPAFSLLYSASHQQSYDKMFRFMDPADADRLMAQVTACDSCAADSVQLLNTTRPNIYIIILESFSNSLFPSLGGENIAPGLDSIARQGLVMTNFYSSTFRTDRALPAILNAFPAQPTTSISKNPEKTRHIASLARSLSEIGYPNAYYYGGDGVFANKQTYLLNTGYSKTVTDKDFNTNAKTGKWGQPDGELFKKILTDIPSDGVPRLTVAQTLSSHEPFEVPYSNPAFAHDEACNAFAYTDSCATAFINALASRPDWDNTLVIIVPDHYGCYPHNPDPADVVLRHRIPLIMTGGALALRQEVNTAASQVDIAATLLDAMELPHDDYKFSRNFLKPCTMPLAFMSTPNYTATVDSTGVSSVYNIEAKRFNTGNEYPLTHADSINAAYLQTIYDTLNEI